MQQILSLSLQVQRALSTVEPESHFSFCPHGSIWGACVGAVHPLHAMETKSVGTPCLSYCSGDLRFSWIAEKLWLHTSRPGDSIFYCSYPVRVDDAFLVLVQI
ncbi:unnamed protein product [Eretmochelys imbricata]